MWKQAVPDEAHLIDVLVSFDKVDREFSQWSIDRVSEARGDPPLEYGHIRQHLRKNKTTTTPLLANSKCSEWIQLDLET